MKLFVALLSMFVMLLSNQVCESWQYLELASELEFDLAVPVVWRKCLIELNAGKTELY